MGVIVWKCGVKGRKKQLIDWSVKIKSTNKNRIEMKTGKRSRKCVLMLSFIFSSFLNPVWVETPTSCCAGGGIAGDDVSDVFATGVCEGFSKLNLNFKDRGVDKAKEKE